MYCPDLAKYNSNHQIESPSYTPDVFAGCNLFSLQLTHVAAYENPNSRTGTRNEETARTLPHLTPSNYQSHSPYFRLVSPSHPRREQLRSSEDIPMLIIQAGGKPIITRRVSTFQIHSHRIYLRRRSENVTIQLHRIPLLYFRKTYIYIPQSP